MQPLGRVQPNCRRPCLAAVACKLHVQLCSTCSAYENKLLAAFTAPSLQACMLTYTLPLMWGVGALAQVHLMAATLTLPD